MCVQNAVILTTSCALLQLHHPNHFRDRMVSFHNIHDTSDRIIATGCVSRSKKIRRETDVLRDYDGGGCGTHVRRRPPPRRGDARCGSVVKCRCVEKRIVDHLAKRDELNGDTVYGVVVVAKALKNVGPTDVAQLIPIDLVVVVREVSR